MLFPYNTGMKDLNGTYAKDSSLPAALKATVPVMSGYVVLGKQKTACSGRAAAFLPGQAF